MRQFVKSGSVRRVGALPRPTPLALAISAMLAPALALSAPTGGVVTSGTASINQSGAVTNIDQSTQKASINWQGFSIGSNETVNFNQPNSSALTLNRVIGNERSIIEGALNANGKVFLINSNGMLFTQGSSINTGGFVGSTLNLTDEDFNAGNYVFKSNGSAGSIINLGTITAKDGGYVALLGNSVSNQGVIVATKGTVALSAGDRITLNFNGDSLLSVSIDEGTLNALVENKQAIYADGGTVILTAKAADELLGAQVNNSGIVQARTVDDLKGSITLYAHGGTAHVDGTLDASAPTGGDGGFIETSGDKVKIADSAKILTKSAYGKNGKWLVDPVDFTIAASGGDMTGTFLSNYLNTQGDYEVQSAAGSKSGKGDINVNDAVTWGSDNTLTLTAVHDININNAITINGAGGGLVMNYGGDYNIRTKASYSGTVLDAKGKLVAQTDTSGGVYGSITFTNSANAHGLTINGNNYTLIYSMSQLDLQDGYDAVSASGAATAVSGNYALAHDLDASGNTYSTALISTFNGAFVGLGHVIDNLNINTTDSSVGVIGQTASGGTTLLRDIGVTNFSLVTSGSGDNYGALLGVSNSLYLTIDNSYSTGSVNTYSGVKVGGLVGATADNGYSVISNSFSSADVTAYLYGGGLLGYAGGATGSSGYYTEVVDSSATGDVVGKSGAYSSGQYLGGLVGAFPGHGRVVSSYASGNVISHSSMLDANTEVPGSYVGGLVGSFNTADVFYSNLISDSYAAGDVIGSYYVGGLVGYITAAASSYFSVTNSHATGDVTATSTTGTESDVGGLIGYGYYLNIDGSYATGDVSESLSEGRYKGLTTNTANYVGGLIGKGTYTTINDSYATGTVSTGGQASDVGGLAGSTTTVSNSYATGHVNGYSYVGGLVGNATTVTGSYSTGDVVGTGMYSGGVAGYATTISDSHASGNVTGWRYAGGIAGSATSIIDSWAEGAVSLSGENSLYAGALVGLLTNKKGVIRNSYWNADNNGQTSAYGATSGTAASSVTMTNTQGLSNTAAEDIAYYANGTIGQVLAARAEAEARAAAFQEKLNEAAETADQLSGSTQSDKTVSASNALWTQTAANASPPAERLEQNIVFADARNFSTDIRRIEVDGKTFILYEDDAAKGSESIR
jgi:filamentous hemagglutinin family protein